MNGMKNNPCPRCNGSGSEFNDKAIGREVRRVRTEAGLAMIPVARLLGVTQGYLSMLERGLRRWTPELIDKIPAVTKRLRAKKGKYNEKKKEKHS